MGSAFGDTINAISAPTEDVQGLAWDGSSIWCVSYEADRVYELNPNNGSILNELPTPVPTPIGLAWDGTYPWHSDENGTFYRLLPSDGSMVDSALSLVGESTTLLDWDGEHLWASTGGVFRQLDTSTWRLLKTLRVPAAFPKGIARDGENLWSASFEDENLCLLDGTPEGGSVSGRVLKTGSSIAGKHMLSSRTVTPPTRCRLAGLRPTLMDSTASPLIPTSSTSSVASVTRATTSSRNG